MQRNLQDQYLIAASVAGDEEAFGKLYDKYVDQIFRFVTFRVSSETEAQDITSETFLKAWNYVSVSSKKIENFQAFLYRIARNLVIDHYRRGGKEFAASGGNLWENLVDSRDLAKDAETKDDIRHVLEAVDTLSEAERQVVEMRYIDDLGIKDIAKALDKKEGTVRTALHRAVKSLKEVLKSS